MKNNEEFSLDCLFVYLLSQIDVSIKKNSTPVGPSILFLVNISHRLCHQLKISVYTSGV